MENNLDIPEHWEYISLVEDFNYVPTGVQEFLGEKKYYSTGSIKGKEYTYEGVYTFSNRPSRANRVVEENDVLQARMKDTNKALFIDNKLNGFLFSTGFFQVRPYGNTYVSKLLYYYLYSSVFLKMKDELCSGSTQSSLNDTNAKKIKVPLPPIGEQYRIVEKIEELFSELDSSIESLKVAKAKLEYYSKTVLESAFEGHFTAEWRNVHHDKLESTESVFKRIKTERIKVYKKSFSDWKEAVRLWNENAKVGKKPIKPKKFKELLVFGEKELKDLPELPKGWQWVKLNEIAEFIQIGPFGSLLHKSEYIKNGIPLINPSHIKDQKIHPDMSLTITKEKALDLEKYLMKENDIILGRRGEMGRCAIVTEFENGFLCGTGSLFIRLLPSLNSQFYSGILGSKRVKEFLEDHSIGTTMQNLNEKILETVPVPIMSTGEQHQIVNEIESSLSYIDIMSKTIEESLRKAEKLRQSILKKAFEGSLVLANSKDEPILELLKRIVNEKKKYKEDQKKVRKNTGRKKVTKNLSLVEVLREAEDNTLKAKDLWKQSKYHDDIEAFYAALKQDIEVDKTMLEIRSADDNECYLRLNSAD